jgi:hypothetical protein
MWSKKSACEIVLELKLGGYLSANEDMNAVHRYLLECCRRIWVLLPDEGSRNGVVAGEKYLRGMINWGQTRKYDYDSEGSAFMFDYAEEGDQRVDEHIRHINQNIVLIRNLLVSPFDIADVSAKRLLIDAAYFANFALKFPELRFGKQCEKEMRCRGKFMPNTLLKKSIPQSLIEVVCD